MKVKKELSDEVRHIYADKYSQHIIESEFETFSVPGKMTHLWAGSCLLRACVCVYACA